MSSMEVFYGWYQPCINAEATAMHALSDDDQRYDWEEKNDILLVEANGTLYEVHKIEDVEPGGFIVRIGPSTVPRVMCMWYNGSAGVHEVLEQAIKEASA